MKLFIRIVLVYLCTLNWFTLQGFAQMHGKVPVTNELENTFRHPPENAKPWTYWYWMQAGITRQGVTADLEAMKNEGIGGAYLMTIKGPANPPYINPPVNQLTKPWWDMIKFAMSEADRLGIKLALHDCDGFAVAGGPWITPELSMQKVVWTKTLIKGGRFFRDTLALPQSYKGYYKDIRILAYPSPKGSGISSNIMAPKVTASTGEDVQFLAVRGNKKSFASSKPCWIQLQFAEPFTCRSLIIHTNASNYESEDC